MIFFCYSKAMESSGDSLDYVIDELKIYDA